MGRARYCSYCYDAGHDRRTCSSLTDWYKSAAEGQRDKGSTSTHYAEFYTKRTGLDLDGNFVGKPKRYRRTSIKRCTWCRSTEHNKRKCPNRIQWLEGKNRDNEAYRYAIQSRAKALKIGIGSLLSESRYFWITDENGERNYTQQEIFGLIEKIDWDEINCDNQSTTAVITVNWVNCPTDDCYPERGRGRREKKILLNSLVHPDRQYNTWGRDTKVIGYSDNPTAGMPENWVYKKGSKFEEPKMGTHWR